MGKKLIALVAAVLVLAGCTAAPSDDGTDSAREVPSSSPTPTETAEPTAAPLAEQPEPEADTRTEAEKAGFKDENEWFLRSVQSSWTGDVPPDDELLAAGAFACEQIAAGVLLSDIVAVQGDSETAKVHNQAVLAYATMALCPQP